MKGKLVKDGKSIKKRSQEKIPTLVHTQKEDYYERQDPSIDTHTLKKGEARITLTIAVWDKEPAIIKY